ncbi:hypothetical protein [Aquidulcibacter sp.]|jgi:hypothetical protein|uniref:hypothetical protein n=1 Tax=Aquidulcibacter sp. TaxID=2052990 RepID=UPI0037BFBA03
MGWFGFGGPRGRGQKKPAVRVLGHERESDERAILVDRRGPISRLPDVRPRRRDFDDPRR